METRKNVDIEASTVQMVGSCEATRGRHYSSVNLIVYQHMHNGLLNIWIDL